MHRVALLAFLLIAWSFPAPASAHGTERHFGTPINGRVPDSARGRGAPEFTVLAIRATLSGLERDLEERRTTEAQVRAQRVVGMTHELVARCAHLSWADRDQIGLSGREISDSARRIDEAVSARDPAAVHDELTRVREQLTAVEIVLRRAEKMADPHAGVGVQPE